VTARHFRGRRQRRREPVPVALFERAARAAGDHGLPGAPADRVQHSGVLQPADAGAAEHDLRAGGRGHSARLRRADRQRHAL